jgi:hypothetical protein
MTKACAQRCTIRRRCFKTSASTRTSVRCGLEIAHDWLAGSCKTHFARHILANGLGRNICKLKWPCLIQFCHVLKGALAWLAGVGGGAMMDCTTKQFAPLLAPVPALLRSQSGSFLRTISTEHGAHDGSLFRSGVLLHLGAAESLTGGARLHCNSQHSLTHDFTWINSQHVMRALNPFSSPRQRVFYIAIVISSVRRSTIVTERGGNSAGRHC